MTLSPWTIYLWGITDQIRTASELLTFLFGLAALASIIFVLFTHIEEVEEDTQKASKRLVRWIIPLFSTAMLFAVFFPNSKTIAMMVVLPAIVNSEPIQKDLPEVYRMAVDALKAQLTPASDKK